MSIVDFHNHLMPAVDDGAQSLEDSCTGLTAFEQQNVQIVITTPHLDGSVTREPDAFAERLAELDAAWALLQAHAQAHHPSLRLERGVELMLDTPEPVVTDPRVRLAGGPFVLFEFPYMTVPPRSAEVIAGLRAGGCLPIIAHPERYNGFAPDFSLAAQWKQSGGLLQVNGASLLGKYGPDARRFAAGLLERGWVDYLGSDFHSRGPLWVEQYRALLAEAGASVHAQLLTETNPARMLEGLPPLPVPPLRPKRSFWDRINDLLQSRR